ncbi:MAG: conserved rane protein of unknown function [Streptosporangiaceae bacterium]|nr:conserved rane protein of unknown function [Streptosporangiaceae bacterium]
MQTRGPNARFLLALGLVFGGMLALAGALELRGAGLVAVAVTGGVSAALAAGVARESAGAQRRAALTVAAQAAGWTVAALLVIAGVAVVGGGVVAAIVTVAGIVLVLALALLRVRRRKAAAPSAVPHGKEDAPRLLLPVANVLPTPALGREWLRSTSALSGRLQPAVRASIVRWRQQTLDELERRDPAGFARWLAAGSAGDPADFVRGDVRGNRGAGTDAA